MMTWICPLCSKSNESTTQELYGAMCQNCGSVFNAHIGAEGVLWPMIVPVGSTRIVKITPCPLAQRFTVLHADSQEVRLLVEDAEWTDQDFLAIDVSIEKKTQDREMNNIHYGRPRILTAGAKGGLRFLP